VDPATFRPRRMDEKERAYLSRFLPAGSAT
jgi:hypothetical protein